jgi:two-component system LytT family response regulator
MLFKCVIIDDDQYAIDAISRYIDQMPNLSVYKTFTSSLEALNEISYADEIDFVFLDIEMPEISGLELAKKIRTLTRFLLFTTSHTKHALAAFDLNANQYLLKPITFAKFALAIDYLTKSEMPSRSIATAQPRRSQFIKADHKNSFHQIDTYDVHYIKAAKNYVVIYTEKEYFITHSGLNHIEEALPIDDFIRISKSYIVAKNAIKKVEGNMIRLKCGQDLQIGSTYKAVFLDFLKRNMVIPTS